MSSDRAGRDQAGRDQTGPGHAGPGSVGPDRLARVFTEPDVAEAYQHRPPYPPEVFTILARLITDQPRDVLDIGAGEGALARPLARIADHVDAVDISPAMVEAGRRRPGGRRPNLRWIVGAAETAPLGGPYALVTAGASVHWMSWKEMMSRLAEVMTGNAVLAIIEHGPGDMPWQEALAKVIVRHSRSAGFDPAAFVADAIAAEGLLDIAGRTTTRAVSFRQSVAEYVEQYHSTSSLARKWMSAEESAAFDRAVQDVVRPYAADGMLEMKVVARLAWGRPVRL